MKGLKMIEQEILQQLQQSVIAAVKASNVPAMPVKLVDVTFTPPDNQQFIEIIHIPNNPADRFWGDEKSYQGIFRIVLHWQIDASGAYPPMRVLESIASYYSKNMWLGIVKITSNPDLTGVIETAPDLLFPCTLRYAAFAGA